MHILVVQENAELGRIWGRHLEREGHSVDLVATQDAAMEIMRHREVNVIVLDVVLPGGSPLAIADFASYRWPEAKVVFVTNTTFFSDGSIFRHAPNACAFLQSDTDPTDLAMMVSHYGAVARSA